MFWSHVLWKSDDALELDESGLMVNSRVVVGTVGGWVVFGHPDHLLVRE